MLCELFIKLNTTFSSANMVSIGSSLFGASLFGFVSCVPLFRKLTLARLFTWISHAISAITLTMILRDENRIGQVLKEEGVRVSEDFEDLLLEHYRLLGPSTRFSACNLAKKLRSSMSVSPFHCFEVSYGSLLTIFGVVVTYIIVLLQFLVST